MRFAIGSVVAAALPAVLAAVIPTSADSHDNVDYHGHLRPNILELELTHEDPKALFKVPCNGDCLGIDGEDDDALIFNFQAFPSQEPCGVANVTVNGQTLAQVWNGTHAVGAGPIASIAPSPLIPQRNLGLSWHSSCINESVSTFNRDSTAQVITVLLHTIDGKVVEQLSGFTISFRPLIPLELLRLSPLPDLTATEPEFAQLWRDPPAHLRLTSRPLRDGLSPVNDELPTPSVTTDPIEELRRLEAEAARIKDLIEQQKSLIEAHSQDEPSTDPRPHVCRSLKCTLNNFVDSAKTTLKDLYMSITPSFASSYGNRPQQVAFEDHGPPGELLPSPTNGAKAQFPSPTRGLTSIDSIDLTASSDSHDEWEALLGHAPSPDFSESPGIDPLSITLKIVGAVTGLTCIYICFRRSRCCNPRAQAERRAEQEERATQAAYRRAARKHHFRQWWSSWIGRQKDYQRITDYEEKRSLIRQQEGVLENAMQDEIRMLRAAHDAVNSIFHTNSRSSTAAPHTTTSPIPIFTRSRRQDTSDFQQTYQHNPEAWQNVPLSRTNSLPDYRSEAGSSHISTEPPAYSDDEGDLVTDGFRGYRPRSGTLSSDDSGSVPSSPVTRERRWTPGSSVVSTSPRPSQETMRYL